MTLGQKIKQARISCGLTQKQLVGEFITRNMLSKIENDSATPSVRTLEYIAGKLGVPVGVFMSDDYSDGTSPDGLDKMREAYKAGEYERCISLLEKDVKAGTTDEGYLLHAKAALAVAKQALKENKIDKVREYADIADYYNKEGIYYSAETDAEMSLLLAECALREDISEFEYNAKEFQRANASLDFATRFGLARAEYLLRTGETELAEAELTGLEPKAAGMPRYLLLRGKISRLLGQTNEAMESFRQAEKCDDCEEALQREIYHCLEEGYLQQENYKEAHRYAVLQIPGKEPEQK